MTPLQTLRKHVTGKIESGQAVAIVGIPSSDTMQALKLTQENFTRIDSDINGNPRYYLPVFMAGEKSVRKIGGVKYRGKQYGPGWVFQSYHLQDKVDALNSSI